MNKLFKLTVCLLVLFTFSPIAFAQRVSALPEIMNPMVISMDKDNLYVTEKTTIYVYCLKEFKLKLKFGTAGEGPGEFQRRAFVTPMPDSLLINSRGRVSYFTRAGKFIMEIKSKYAGIGRYLRIGENYAGIGTNVKDKKYYETFSLFDSKLAKVKEFHRNFVDLSLTKIDPLGVRYHRYICKAYKEKLYVSDYVDGTIDVFDKNGKHLRTITYPYKDLEVTKEHQKEMLEHYEINPETKAAYARFKDYVEFPRYYPKFYDFFVDGNIYVLTYNRSENQAEFLVFDSKGAFVKKIMVPFYQTNMHITYPYTIRDGKLYQLVENEDEEQWELHITKINQLWND